MIWKNRHRCPVNWTAMKCCILTAGRSRLLIAVVLLAGSLLVSGCRKTRAVSVPKAPAGPARLADEPRVRILLAENFSEIDVEGAQRAQKLRVVSGDGEIQLFRDDGAEGELLGRGSGFRLVPVEEVLRVGGREYRGYVDAFVNPLGRPTLVNDLQIEDYLMGVVPRELGPRKYPELEALKAQTVAARTFAIDSLGRNAEKGFDMYLDSRSQVYGGFGAEEPLSNRAVRETRGVVASYGGKPIVSLYCSTCGGVTESFELIFKGGPIDYLRGGASCRDDSSPYHEWDEWIDLNAREADVSRFAGFGRLKDLEILSRSSRGRVIRMKFVGDGREAVLEGNDLRFALGLRSNWLLSLEFARDQGGWIEKIHVKGKGWGHGVGLCQIGAVEMAAAGKDFGEIIRHYYQGVELKLWYR